MTGTTRPLPLRREALALWTVPNLLTLVRIAIVPVLVYLLRDPGKLAGALAAALVFIASLTDYFDGYLARKHGIVTTFGKFLDPLADKFLVLGGFIVLAINGDFAWLPVGIVAARELGISLYRSAASRRGISLPARQLGKWKAVFQFLAVGFVLLPWTADLEWFLDVMLWTAVVISVVSAVDIMRQGWVEARNEV